MDEMVNPYIAGSPVAEPRMFFGREDVFEWIGNNLSGRYADHALVIHGQRRVGKTSVLKQLDHRLPQRYIPIFFDLQGRTNASLEQMLWWLAREITHTLNHKRGLEIPPPARDDFSASPDHFEHRFLPDLQPLVGDARLLFAFDEFDILEDRGIQENLARPLIDCLRRLMNGGQVNFIFSIGSSGNKLENMRAAYTEFFKTALYKKISFLDKEQTRRLVAHPVEGILHYEPKAVERIFQVTGGQPYFTQLTCHELFAKCQQTGARRVQESDVNVILEDVVERGTVNLKFVWDEVADMEKWVLTALAQLDQADNRAVGNYLRRERVHFSEADLNAALTSLRKKDVLTSDNRFIVHLVKMWLQKNRPIEQTRGELTKVSSIVERYVEIGMEYKIAGMYDKAVKSFREALEVSANHLQAQVNLAACYAEQNDYAAAVVEFEKALAIDEEDEFARSGLCAAHLALGDAAMLKGDPNGVESSYRRILSIDAGHGEARGRMAKIARMKAEQALEEDRKQESLSALKEALKYTPDDLKLREAARSLARSIALEQRRWYGSLVLWGAVAALIVAGLIYLVPEIQVFYAAPVALPSASPTTLPTETPIPTITPSPTPTAIPLTWKRISMGQGFLRDAVTAFATDKNDTDIIYVGMKNAGVYKSIDGGLSWSPAHQGLSNTQVESLLIDSQIPRILYAGTLSGIFKTDDGGENWHKIGKGTYLLMDYQDNSHFYARDGSAIYETTDQGNTWNTVYALKQNCPDTISSWAIHPQNSDMLLIGGGETCAGMYQSSDGGHTWTLIGLKEKPNLNSLAIGLDEHGNYSIYTSFSSSVVQAENGIYFSHDGGSTWSQTQSSTTMGLGNCDTLTSDPYNPATIYCAKGWLYVLRNKGDTWRPLPDTQNKAYSSVYIDHPNGTDRIITGRINNPFFDPEVGIFLSTNNGLSWTERNNGIGSARSELKIDPMDNNRMYLATNFYSGTLVIWKLDSDGCILYRSTDRGKNWSSIKTADWCGPSFDSVNSFYLKETDMLQKLQGGGENWLWNYCPDGRGLGIWQQSETQVKCNAYNTRTLMGFALPEGSQSVSANPYLDNLIYAVGNNIYYSTTGSSSSWQLSAGSEDFLDARLFYANQGKTIYAVDRDHQKYSTDNGMTWQPCGQDVTTSRSDSRLALDLQGKRLYLATPGQGVLVSTDQCQSWQPSNNGLTNLFVNTLAIDPNNLDIVYAGTDGGAYISFDGGQTWGQVNDGLLGATVVYSIAVDKDSNVYAATPYGIFKLEGK